MTIAERIKDFQLLAGQIGFGESLYMKTALFMARMRHGRTADGSGAGAPPVRLRINKYPYPIWFRPNTSDIQVFYHVFVYQQYSVFDDVQSPKLIVDCGAYAGYSTLWFLNRFPTARVVAIEPDPENLEMCKRNLDPYRDRVRLLHAAVWSTQTQLSIENAGGSCAKWATHVEPASGKKLPTVNCVTLNEIVASSGNQRINILKMDIEGAERHVFSEHTEPWLSCVDNIVIELHGTEESKAFDRAMSAFEHVRLSVDETIVCRNMRPARS